jgi:uncharacterized protein (DUF427 family)
MTEFLEPDERIRKRRDQWRYRGSVRPPFALAPGIDEESVWDYPRPPRLVHDPRPVEVRTDEEVIASTTRAIRVLETASPPTYYIPPEDVNVDSLEETGQTSFCEWKGLAVDLRLAGKAVPSSVAWVYPRVFREFEAIAGWYAFYPGRIACSLDGEHVLAQPGGYYGGWVTQGIVGPIKGEHGCDGL